MELSHLQEEAKDHQSMGQKNELKFFMQKWQYYTKIHSLLAKGPIDSPAI